MSLPISFSIRCRTGLTALILVPLLVAPAAAQFKKDVPIPCEAVKSIGTAEMDANGVITLQLHSLEPNPIAEGVLTYAPDDPQYQEIKDHLGGISPGETKPVRPWCK